MILSDPSGRQSFSQEKNGKRTEIREDPSGRQNLLQEETRQDSFSGKPQEKFLEPPDRISSKKKRNVEVQNITVQRYQEGSQGSVVRESKGGSASVTPPDGAETLRLPIEQKKV